VTFPEPVSASAIQSAKPVSPLRLHFIDVGYGDAILIEIPEGERILIDGGEAAAFPQLRAALQQRNIHTIDKVIITHFHSDHVGALPSILENFVPLSSNGSKNIFMPFKPESSALTAPLKQHAVRIVRRGETLMHTDTLQISVLHPHTLSGNQNEDSLVLKITHGNLRFLLAADADPNAQKKLYARYGDALKCDLLKIPHHANDSRVFAPFLASANPQIAILTIGENHYQAPNEAVLALYQAQSETLFRTDRDGDITVSCDGHKLNITCEWV